MATKPTVALVKKSGNQAVVPITTAGDQFFIRLAKELRSELLPPQLASCYDKMKDWESSMKALKENVRDRIITLLKDSGTVTSEKGTLVLEDGGWELTARPHRTGFDARKVEALLRAKGLEVDRYMDQEIVFKLNEGKLTDAVAHKKLTADELETCRYELSYALQAPKRTE